MRFDLQWMCDHLLNPPDADLLADRLTACGLLVETREPVDDSEIWDIDVTTNRPDAMNHRGLAREAGAATGAKLKERSTNLSESSEAASGLVSVEIEAPDLCSRYVARVLRNVKIVESPQWLQQRLENCGVRPINAVVDATNYVLLELGQPLHAFDLNRVAERSIVVRRAGRDKELVTLDGETRPLDDDALVIADRSGPIALAGIMGGANSEIDEATTDIVLESAHFDAISVRRTARRLGMHTEASHRFERGADPEIAGFAADAAAALIASLTGATIAKGAVDNYPRPHEAVRIDFAVSTLSSFAGLDISADTVKAILTALEFEVEATGDNITCTAPSFRIDMELAADVYEEIIRHVGYDRVPAELPTLPSTPGRRSANWQLIDRGREGALAAGLAEIVTYGFIDQDSDALIDGLPLPGGRTIALDNPLALTQAVMRRSLLPGLLSATRESLSKGERDIAIFEQGRVFFEDATGNHEQERIGVVLSGNGIGWPDTSDIDFFHLKGVLESLLTTIGFPELAWGPAETSWLTSGQGALITAESTLGMAGLLAPAIARSWDLRQDVYVAEINLDGALAEQLMPTFEPLPRYPSVATDMTIEHDRHLEYRSMIETLRDLASDLVEDIDLVTRYEGEELAAGRIRTTVRVVYRHDDRSLTQDEVNDAHEKLRRQFVDQLDVQLA